VRTLYADIIVDISHEKLDKAFQYKIPEHLVGLVEVGMRVLVPFGNGNVTIQGFCVEITDRPNFNPQRIKEIIGPVPKGTMVEDRMIELAKWIRKNYGCTMIQALKTVLPVKQKFQRLEHRTLQVAVSREELIAQLGEAKRKKNLTARARLLEELLKQDSIPYEWVTGKLNISSSTIQSLQKIGIIRVESSLDYRNPVHLSEMEDSLPVLSEEQQEIVDTFREDYDRDIRKCYLIHGITGSGKTEVYMRLIGEVIARGKQAIVLIPEIALTYQTLLRFYKRFHNRVSVMNSTLSPGEKYDQCERAKNGEIDVIIGPRSALFTPFPNIGLIVIDEEHESSYKSESAPKYHARETAMELARLHNASVVLGSATPSIESYYRCKTGEYTLFELRERLTGGTLPSVYTVDLRQELKDGNRSIFSRKLLELLQDRLEKGQQSMLFLNRRGYASFISCRSCGHVMKCPHCDVSLSEHEGDRLVCHYCGFVTPKPTRCPECGSKYIMGFRAGTQKIEQSLKEVFPHVRTLRMDKDTTGTKDSYEKILSAFANEEADVLIGTQMIVKGHDFPNVTLVGVLAADLSLSVGDYRAGERTFQLLTQAVGRAGRGKLSGEAVIQTYQPDHYAVICAAAQDYESFYEEEIVYRDLGGYPPTAHMLAVQIYSKEEALGLMLANRLADVVKLKGYQDTKDVFVLGPAKAGIGKINDIYRFVFYVKAKDYSRLVGIKDLLEEKMKENDEKNLLVLFDFDPMNIL